jgi:hypothetical protein
MARKIKIGLVGLICFTCFTCFTCVSANAGPTTRTPWKVVDNSMGELLDSGWKIVSHSGFSLVVSPGTLNASIRETLSYILHKDGKYINCFINNPYPDRSASACRQLNGISP